jgi:thioredoxin-dependent peroxiredoxin
MRAMLPLMLSLVPAAMMFAGAATAGELKPGDPAPGFSLPGSDGKTYRLTDFKGKKAVVLAWFPKAFTGG